MEFKYPYKNFNNILFKKKQFQIRFGFECCANSIFVKNIGIQNFPNMNLTIFDSKR